MKKKCAFVFGGLGFIGSYFIEFILNSKKVDKVLCFDLQVGNSNLRTANLKKLMSFGDSVEIILADVRENIDAMKYPFNPIFIANFAAIHREPGHEDYEYFDTNILGAENVCNLAEHLNCNEIIFSSSISPYGKEDKLKDEDTVPCPNTPYGSSKLAAEKIHIAWQNRDLKKRILTIVRPGVVFGKGEGGNMSRLVNLIHKNFFFYMGNKDTRKAGIYVKELVKQILWVREKQVQNKLLKITLFNATMWPNPSISDYVNTVKKVAGIKRFVPSVPFWFLMSFGITFEFLFKAIGKQNPFSPVRLSKLVRPNLVKPSFLLKNKYKPIYTLRSALEDWKKEDPEVWP